MYLIRNVTVVDGTGSEPQKEMDLLFDQTGIKEIAKTGTVQVPGNYEVIDGKGKAVLPGLIDIHIHMDLHGYADTYDENLVEDKLRTVRTAKEMEDTLKAGFTTVRNVGSVNGIDFAVKKAVESGYSRGPRILTSGKIISITAEGNDYFAGMYREADGVEEVCKAAREQLKMGADFLKVMATGAVMNPGGVPGAPQLDIEEIQAVVKETRKLGTHVAAHAHGTEGIRNAILAGVRTIEHGTYLDDECIDLMLEKDVFLVPTPIVGYHMAVHDRDSIPEHMMADFDHEENSAEQSHRNAVKAGVKCAYGTDAATNYNFHGLNAMQMALFVQQGIYTPVEAINCATLSSAEAIGLDDRIGSIEKGKIADLVLINESLLRDLKGLEKGVEMVFFGGERV